MSKIELLLMVGVLVPLASFLLLALFGWRLGKPWAGWAAVGAMTLTTGLATAALWQWHHLDPVGRAAARSAPVVWAHLGSLPVTFGVNLDSLTLIMFFMVSFVSLCIFVFSVGYMAGHSDQIDGISKFHRFFTYLSLFCFSMLLLVIADSLLLLFIAWELVGLCSYLLIGYYFHKKSASDAAIKAFVTNRVGDFGFLIGLGLVVAYLGDLSLAGAAEKFHAQYVSWTSGAAAEAPLFARTFAGLSLATWMGMLLFCGAIGKSAQFPLHVWLPDAMEGPTPVSALIHAATMVAAGVYLTARIFVLLTPEAQLFVAVIGCITLTLAALVAIVQTDIKKVLAYSTISQLGYMILGLGVGAWIAALFHLLTHAFFKALMFLGSGQVIEGCHHEQDIRRMGALARKMPVTAVTFLVGVLAIAGAGVPAVWLPQHVPVGLGGYFSKDEILAVAWHRVYGHPHGDEAAHDHQARADALGGADTSAAGNVAAHGVEGTPTTAGQRRLPAWLFWIPVLMAYVTPFYMMRCWWLTFMGRPRDPHVYEHAHESPLMYVPLIVLAVGTVVSGYVLFRPMVADAAPTPFLTAAYDGSDAGSAVRGVPIAHEAHAMLATRVGLAFVVGFVLAWGVYRRGLELASRLAAALRPLHTLLVHKFYFDELYGALLVGGTMALKSLLYAFDHVVVDGLVNLSAWLTERLSWFSGRLLDQAVVDGAVNGVGSGTLSLGGLVRRPQVGRIRSYLLFAAGSLAAAVIWFAWVEPRL
jgi:NADH-quinone oxidoreductase subunit L